MGNKMDDFDERGWLPSWILQQMIDAERYANAKKVEAITYPSIKEIQEKVAQRNPTNSIAWTLKNLGFIKNKWWVYPAFLWKNILDLWGGFWWTSKELELSAQNIVVIDPIFRMEDLDLRLQWQISGQKDIIDGRQSWFDSHPDKVHIAEEIEEMKQVLEDLLWWKNEYQKERYPHIKRNNSYGENIVWVEDNSQDYVFLNYVLTKSTVDAEWVLNEAHRVLKKWWKIIVSDSNEIIQTILPQIMSQFKDIDRKENPKKVILTWIKK